MGDLTGGASLDRYTTLVAALLGVRTDHASARFDTEVMAALAANRLDVATARTLRWWQRASVREVEEYTSSVLPPVLAAGSDAETAAAIDSDAAAASWLQALNISPSPAPSTVVPTDPAPVPVPAPASEPVPVPVPTSLPARVITIPDPSRHPLRDPLRDPSTRRRSAKEIQQAVREALRATAAPLNPGPPFDVRSAEDASSPGRDRGDHAHTAPTA
jgi:hypothetical protein